MKACTKCKQEQPLTEYNRDKQKADGRGPRCKSCRSVSSADYYQKNKEAIAANRAGYRLDNKEAINAKQAEYRADPVKNLRRQAVSAFNVGLRSAAKHNNGVKPVISADEKELMVSFLMAARTLSELTGIAFEVDHIHPLSKGGAHSLSNLQCITREDNRAKCDKLNFTDYTQEPSYPSCC